MIYKSSRRSLLRRGAGIVLAYGARGIIPGILWSVSRVATAVDYRDLIIRTAVPAVNGPNSNLVLTAESLRDGVDVAGLNGFEGNSHDHPIIVTASQIAQLNNGQTVNGQTQGVNGDNSQHTHGFSISPTDYASTRILKGEDEATSDNSNTSEDASNSSTSINGLSNSFAITLTEDITPYLIVESRYELQSSNISYGVSSDNSEPTNFLALGRLAIGGGRYLYRSQAKVSLEQVKYIHVYGKNRDGELLHDAFEIGRR